jgi:hypothetical protein
LHGYIQGDKALIERSPPKIPSTPSPSELAAETGHLVTDP